MAGINIPLTRVEEAVALSDLRFRSKAVPGRRSQLGLWRAVR